MATGKKVPLVPEYKVVLELSIEEAEVLRTVVGKIGGSSLTLRRHTDAISSALGDAEVRWRDGCEIGLTGSLSFVPR